MTQHLKASHHFADEFVWEKVKRGYDSGMMLLHLWVYKLLPYCTERSSIWKRISNVKRCFQCKFWLELGNICKNTGHICLFPSEASRMTNMLVIFSLLDSYTHYLQVSSADYFCKQFGSRSGPTICWAWSGFKLFTLMIFLKEFFEKI